MCSFYFQLGDDEAEQLVEPNTHDAKPNPLPTSFDEPHPPY